MCHVWRSCDPNPALKYCRRHRWRCNAKARQFKCLNFSIPKLEPTHSLLRQFRGGQVDAATELYSRYATRLLELARSRTGVELGHSVDPEDVVQSVFRTFFRRAAEGSYSVPNGDTLWKLLMVIALNKIRSLADYHRAGKRDLRRTQPIVGVLPSDHEQESLNNFADHN